MTTQTNYAKLLAFAKTKCPECGSGGGPDGPDGSSCSFCSGTGLVFLLPDSVRERCQMSGHYRAINGVRGHDFQWCRGYTVLDPITGGDTWAQAVWPLLTELAKGRLTWADHVRYQHEYMTLRAEGYTTAALGVIWRAFVAAGIVKEEAA